MAQCGLSTSYIWNILQDKIVDSSELLSCKANITTEDISSERSRLKDELKRDLFDNAYEDIWRLAREQNTKLSTDEYFAERKLDLAFDNDDGVFKVISATNE